MPGVSFQIRLEGCTGGPDGSQLHHHFFQIGGGQGGEAGEIQILIFHFQLGKLIGLQIPLKGQRIS